MADRRADESPPSGLCFPPAVRAHSGWSPKTAQGVPLGYPLCVFAPTPSPVGSGVVNALFTRRDPMHRRGRGLNASPPRLIGCPNYFRRGWLPIRLAKWVRGDEYLRQNKNYIKVLRGLGCFFKSTPSVLPYSYKQQFSCLSPPWVFNTAWGCRLPRRGR